MEAIWSSLFAKALEGETQTVGCRGSITSHAHTHTGKDVGSLISNVGSGAAAAAAPTAGGGGDSETAAKEEEKEEKKEESEEESDDDMGFGTYSAS